MIRKFAGMAIAMLSALCVCAPAGAQDTIARGLALQTRSSLALRQNDAKLLRAASAAGDTRIFFIPVSTDTIPWATGGWNSTVSFSANAQWVIAGDGIHPPEIGTAYYARRINAAIRSIVLPALAKQVSAGRDLPPAANINASERAAA